MNHPREVYFPCNSSASNRRLLVTDNLPSSLRNHHQNQNQNQNQNNEGGVYNNGINTYINNQNRLSPKYPSSSIQPSLSTVVIGKGKIPKNAPGNIHFRNLVRDRLQEYVDAKSKAVKSSIVTNVYSSIQETCFREQGVIVGAFLRYDHGFYTIASESAAREKISATFRDCLSNKYKSSSKNKVAKRRLANKERTAAEGITKQLKHLKEAPSASSDGRNRSGSALVSPAAAAAAAASNSSSPSSSHKSTNGDCKDNKTYFTERNSTNPTIVSISRNPQHPVSNLMRRSSDRFSEPIPISAFSINNQHGTIGRDPNQKQNK